MKEKESYTSCVKCGNLGIERSAEVLPDKGILIKVFHDDGKLCKFVEYSSLSIFLDRSKRKKNPVLMDCPICGKTGRIASYRPNKAKQYHHWKYYINHENLEGYWGKKQNIQKCRRCYMKTEEQKNLILEKLGYIS